MITGFAPDEPLVLAADGWKLNQPLGEVIVDLECAVFGVAAQRLPLIQGVGEGFADQAFAKHVGLLFLQLGFGSRRDGSRALISGGEECLARSSKLGLPPVLWNPDRAHQWRRRGIVRSSQDFAPDRLVLVNLEELSWWRWWFLRDRW